MKDGAKPPPSGPGQVQMPGGEAQIPRAPPPSRRSDPFLKSPTSGSPPPAPFANKPPISNDPQNLLTDGKAPAGGIPASAPESSGAGRLPTPAEGSAAISESSGDRRLPTPPGGIRPKRPDPSTLRHTGANPFAAPIESKPPFNGEAPLTEPPAAKPQPPAANASPVQEVPAPKKDSVIPVDVAFEEDETIAGAIPAVEPSIEVTFEEDEPPQEEKPALAILAMPSFGAIDANAKLALEILFSILPENKGKQVELKEGKVFIGGKECGDIYSTKGSGTNLRLSFKKLGITNAQLIKNDEHGKNGLRSKISSSFNTINDAFLVRACESETNEYAAIVASASGVRLCFYKAASDAPSNSFPLKQNKEEDK